VTDQPAALPSNDYTTGIADALAEFIPPAGPMTDEAVASAQRYAGDFQNLVDGLTDRLKEAEGALEAVQIASHLKDRTIDSLRKRADTAEQQRDELLHDRDMLFRYVRLIVGGGKEILAQVMQPVGRQQQPQQPKQHQGELSGAPVRATQIPDAEARSMQRFGADNRRG
jgi:hypothetical protein